MSLGLTLRKKVQFRCSDDMEVAGLYMTSHLCSCRNVDLEKNTRNMNCADLVCIFSMYLVVIKICHL